MKTAMINRVLACLVASFALKGVAAESPESAVSRMESRTKDPTRDPGLFGDYWWANRFLSRHRLIEGFKGKTVDVVMLGDSITHFWEWKHPKSWARFTNGKSVLNLGYGGDKTENVIWRIEHGELDGYTAKCVVLMVGTNNNTSKASDPAAVAKGVEKIVAMIRARQPMAKLILHPIFPRGRSADSPHAEARVRNDKTNALLKEFAERDGKVVWVDFGERLVDGSGWVPASLMADEIHPTDAGYDIWMNALVPHISLPPAQSDAARMGATAMNPGGALRCMERIGGGDFKVLIYGNSIALHAPKADIGWTNCWGMAASAAEKDFAHLVVAGLEAKLGKKADFRIRNLATLERNFATNIATVAEIAADADWKPDYVVIAIGENSPNIDKLNSDSFQRFLSDIARPFVKNRAKVVLRSPFWRNPAKASCTARAAAEVGAVYVDAGHLGDKDENKAIGLFSHGGVANHPGDLGMKRLADLILGGFNEATENPAERAEVKLGKSALRSGLCRVTDSVNAGRKPARIPQGAGEFEVERPRTHGGAVVNAADFGFSTTNDLNASAVMRALDFCRAAGASRLVLTPGTYNCFDPDHGLVVADMEDFTLDGAGATLVFRRPARRLAATSVRVPHDSSLLVTNCQRCVVGNFSIDWDWKGDPLCDVGVVTATHVDGADDKSYFDLELPDWPQGHPWYGRPMPIQTMTPINKERTRLTGDDPCRLLFGLTEGHFGTKMKWLSPNSIRVWPGVREPGQYAAPVNDYYYGAGINRQTASKMRKGVNYRVFHHYYGKNGITVHSGRHVTVENVNVLSCFGMPIVVDGSLEYGEFRKVVMKPVPGRPCTGTSDGCHIARSKGHIKFIDCVISFQNDDGLNIHDCFTLGVPDGSRRIRVTNARGPEYLGAQPGNEIELLAPNFRPLGWKGRLVATEGDCLVVDRDLPPLEGEHFLVFDNTFQSDHIMLRGCVFHDTHLREIVQPKHVTVENCAFIRTGAGFKMGSAHSREFWCEGRGSRDVVIRGCVFEHDSALSDWWGDAAPVFETYVRFPKPRPYPPGNDVFTSIQPEGFDIAFHGDILVEKCRLTDPAGLLFSGNPVSNLIFRDNEIVLTGARRVREETGSFVFGAARDVFITGNRYAVSTSVGEFEPSVKGKVPGLVVDGNIIVRE